MRVIQFVTATALAHSDISWPGGVAPGASGIFSKNASGRGLFKRSWSKFELIAPLFVGDACMNVVDEFFQVICCKGCDCGLPGPLTLKSWAGLEVNWYPL